MPRHAHTLTAALALPALALGLAACSAKSTPPGPSTTAAPAASSTTAPTAPSTTATTAAPTTTASTTGSTSTTSGATGTSTAKTAAFCKGGKPGMTTTIVIKQFTFTTCPDTVKPGATITVKNEDTATHTVTAIGAHKGAFDTGDIPGGSSKTFTAPTTPGTYRYICTVHPFMHGTLVVS